MTDSEYTISPNATTLNEVLVSSGGTADCFKVSIRNRFYLIKRPKANYANNSEYLQLFNKEFDLGVQLNHPNIVRYYDLGKDERGVYIRMDYVDGVDLETFVQQNPDFFKQRKNRTQFIDELLSAIGYMHSHEMLHLDIKPQNILITTNGNHVKLIDLGFAWTQAYRTHSGYSKDFCAPEQLEETLDGIGPATDIYAIGKVFERYHLVPQRVIQRCTRTSISQRYQNVEDLRKRLAWHAGLRNRIFWSTIICILLVVPLTYILFEHKTKNTESLTLPVVDTIVVHQRDTIVMIEQPRPKTPTAQERFRASIRHAFDSIYAPLYKKYPTYTEDMKFEAMDYFYKAQKYADERLSLLNLDRVDEIEYTQIISEETTRVTAPYNRMALSYLMKK